MTRTDFKVLFTALGFAAVVVHGKGKSSTDNHTRALSLSIFIEEFCRAHVPEAFGEDAATQATRLQIVERMTDSIVSITRETGKQCEPHELKDKGFTDDEITQYWAMAFALASVQLGIEPKDS
jgi:hypothetical protein